MQPGTLGNLTKLLIYCAHPAGKEPIESVALSVSPLVRTIYLCIYLFILLLVQLCVEVLLAWSLLCSVLSSFKKNGIIITFFQPTVAVMVITLASARLAVASCVFLHLPLLLSTANLKIASPCYYRNWKKEGLSDNTFSLRRQEWLGRFRGSSSCRHF